MSAIDEIISLKKSTEPKSGHHLSLTGKLLLGLTGGIAVGLSIICVPFVSPALRKYCLPYIPATNSQIENVFKALNGRKGKLVDLGSGDGRIVIEGAKHNFISHGVELNRWLVYFARIAAFRSNNNNKMKFFKQDLWKFQLSPYNNIVIFGVEQMMARLEQKICLECGEDTNVVACRFPLPNLKPCKIVGIGVDTVWLYRIR